ncbi:MAG: GNAT family N-acetyltransferase [Frankiaceae bacterium]|nr:GNAT family N-acetyltransferase [Frankiaceae bacterium]
MKVEQVEDPVALKDWQAVAALCWDHDHVALPADTLEERLPSLDPALPDGGERTEFFLGVVDRRAVGVAEVNFPTVDNLKAASSRVQVLPDERRQGFGAALLAAVLDRVEAAGRSRVFFEVPSAYPAGVPAAAPLLRSVGARPVLKEVRRLLDLTEQPTLDVPVAEGYCVMQWVDEAPDELVDGLAYLCARMSTDAPQEEMEWEPEIWDGARYREKEAAAMARGRIRYAAAAVHVASGEVAAMTDIGVSRHLPEVAYQWDTIVMPEHRGHGLGLAIKTRNHDLLAASSPESRWLNTWNAEVNTHMIAINQTLGFRPVEYWTEWQLDR